MPGGAYREFVFTGPKIPIKGEDIGAGQIGLSHLHPSLFIEFQKFWTHKHEGASSVKLTQASFFTIPTRYVPIEPIIMYSESSGNPTSFTDLDLSANVGERTVAVAVRIAIKGNAVGSRYEIRKNGGTNATGDVSAWSASVSNVNNVICGVDSSKIIEHRTSNANDTISLRLAGYFEKIL